MLKLVVNRVRIDLKITPETPLLIKAGDKGAAMLHPERPALMFVRTGSRERETVYIPGSSLKGVFRSSAERVLRTVELEACDPLDHDSPCHRAAGALADELARKRGGVDPRGEAAERVDHPQADVYRMLCHACRTFGSQALASRVSFADAYPPEGDRARANTTEQRSSVAIDRQTGGPGKGKLFDMELVTGGSFDTSIHLTNVELWQLALVGLVLHDIEAGFVRLGSSKSRGLGQVKVEPVRLVFEQTDPRRRLDRPAGVGALRPDLVKPYGLRAGATDLVGGAYGGEEDPASVGRRWRWTGSTAAWALLDGCAGEPWTALCDAGSQRNA
ncbi:CRISPR-associated RAMP protein Csx7 [Sorangium sp. So ce296]|uniref:type III CRISPR-associated RAMP protein Csx7 n=1 Tax=Sorangium sp. So ce296 TaxID=3133296 RepID=UPI003F62E859